MSLAAPVVNGELTYKSTETTKTGNTNVKSSSSSAGALDKDAFLQLLVAEMKYQDPLEPTENTEYISQFTSFSELEQMQNLSNTMELQRASNLVGQYVLLNETNETTGDVKTVMGKVDYVFYEGGKPYLHVNGGDYSLDTLDTVIDSEYYYANNLATDFMNSFQKLPTLANLSLGYADMISGLRTVYDSMSDYQKTFVPADYVSGLSEYEARLHELSLAAEAEAGDEDGE